MLEAQSSFTVSSHVSKTLDSWRWLEIMASVAQRL